MLHMAELVAVICWMSWFWGWNLKFDHGELSAGWCRFGKMYLGPCPLIEIQRCQSSKNWLRKRFNSWVTWHRDRLAPKKLFFPAGKSVRSGSTYWTGWQPRSINSLRSRRVPTDGGRVSGCQRVSGQDFAQWPNSYYSVTIQLIILFKGCRPCRRPRKQVWWISYIWLLVEAGKSWYQPKKYINCTLRVVDSGVQFLKKLGPLV